MPKTCIGVSMHYNAPHESTKRRKQLWPLDPLSQGFKTLFIT